MRFKTSSFFRSLALAAPLALLPTASGVVLEAVGIKAGFATVQAQEEAKPQRKTRKTPALSQPVHKKLAGPTALMNPPEDSGEEPNFPEALKELKDIERKDAEKWNKYEKASLYNLMGYAYYSVEDYKNAIKYYQLVIAQSPEIPFGLEISTTYTVAQLQMVQEDFPGAIKSLKRWFEIQDPVFINGDNHALLASACYQVQDFNCSLQEIEKALAWAANKGEIGKENWYSIKMAILYDRNQYADVLEILKVLVRNYPKQSYWKQLASMYGLTKQDKQAMYMTDAAYVGGAIEQSSELLNLAYMFMGEGYYYRAAKIMEAGFKEKQIESTTKNLQTLAQAWQLSQETDKAIAVMLEAAEKSDGGDVWAKLAGSYIDDFQNQKAIDAGKKALDKGGVKRVDQLHIVMGMAYANLNRWDSCINSFNNAAKDSRSKKFAGNWKKFCTSEKEREEALAAAG